MRFLHGSNASPAFNHHCSTLKAQISYAKYITGKFYYKTRQAKKISSQECNITECPQAATRHQYNIPSTYRNITSVENVSATILPSSVRRSYQSMSTRHTYIRTLQQFCCVVAFNFNCQCHHTTTFCNPRHFYLYEASELLKPMCGFVKGIRSIMNIFLSLQFNSMILKVI